MSLLGEAIGDFKKAVLQPRLWTHLGWVDVKQRYRRSVLGPWWISLSMLIFILMMGIVFSRLFHQELAEYVPFFTTGFLFWTFISGSTIEAAEIFSSNSGFIKQANLPFSLYIFKHLARQLIIFAHNAVIYVLICTWFKINPGAVAFLAIPGFMLLTVNVYWLCLLVGILCSRYRDMVPIIASCVQIAFFVTPISWMPKLLDQNVAFLKYNPLAYLLEIVRSPLLGVMPSMTSLVVASAMAALGVAVSLYVFSVSRPRIAFWVD
jgi:ABC-type polysaccharide/polyol phosphate export permease